MNATLSYHKSQADQLRTDIAALKKQESSTRQALEAKVFSTSSISLLSVYVCSCVGLLYLICKFVCRFCRLNLRTSLI